MEVIKKDNKQKEVEENSLDNRSNFLLNKFYLDAIIDVNSLIKDSQIMTWNALKSKPDFNISIKDTQNILEKYSESKMNLIILHIDLVGFTRMSLSLPIDRLTTIIRSFAQQMSIVVSMYGGYVLKYIGDAVLAFFVIDNDQDKSNTRNKDDSEGIRSASKKNKFYSLQYTNAIRCAFTMIKIVQEGINPILNQYDYPELRVRVGMDLGEVAAVQYGMDIEEFEENTTIKRPHIDLIGYTISIAVKMTGLAKPDNIVIGKKLFEKLDNEHQRLFRQLPENLEIWNYFNEVKDKVYSLYESSCL